MGFGRHNTDSGKTENHPCRLVHLTYSSSGSDADNLNRLDAIKDDDGQDQAPGTVLAAYTYVGLGTIVIEDYQQPDVKLDYFVDDDNSGTSGTYEGFDRFDRVVNHKWYDYGADEIRDQYTYGYDRASNRLYRENTTAANKDEYYTYLCPCQLAGAGFLLRRGSMGDYSRGSMGYYSWGLCLSV